MARWPALVPALLLISLWEAATHPQQEAWVNPEADDSEGAANLSPFRELKRIKRVPSQVELSLNSLEGLRGMNTQLKQKLREGPTLPALRAQERRQKDYVHDLKRTLKDVKAQQEEATKAMFDRRATEFAARDSKLHRMTSFIKDDPEDPPGEKQAVEQIPVDCEVGNWGTWSTCVGNYRLRARKVEIQPENGGWGCKSLTQRKTCANCRVGAWNPWSACKFLKTHRTRVVLEAAMGGGVECPQTREEKQCNSEQQKTNRVEVEQSAAAPETKVSQFTPKHGNSSMSVPARPKQAAEIDAMVIPAESDNTAPMNAEPGTAVQANEKISANEKDRADQESEEANKKEKATLQRSRAEKNPAGPSDFEPCQDRYTRWCGLNKEADSCRDPLYASRCVKTCDLCKKSKENTKYSDVKTPLVSKVHGRLSQIKHSASFPSRVLKPSKFAFSKLSEHLRAATVKQLTVPHCDPIGEQEFWGSRAKVAKDLVPANVGVVTPMFGSRVQRGAWDDLRGRALLGDLKGQLVHSTFNPGTNPRVKKHQLIFAQSLHMRKRSPVYEKEYLGGTRHCLRRIDLELGQVDRYFCLHEEKFKDLTLTKPSTVMLSGVNWQDPFSGFSSTRLYVLQLLHTEAQQEVLFHVIDDDAGKAAVNKTRLIRIAGEQSKVLTPASKVSSFMVSYNGRDAETAYLGVNHPDEGVVYELNLDACISKASNSRCVTRFHACVKPNSDFRVASFVVHRPSSKVYVADSLHNSILETKIGDPNNDIVSTLIGSCDINIAKMIRMRCSALGPDASDKDKKQCCVEASTALKNGERNNCCHHTNSLDAYGLHSAQIDVRSGHAGMVMRTDKATNELYLYLAETSGRRVRRVAVSATNPDVQVVANMVQPQAIAATSDDLWVYDDGCNIARVNIELKVPCGEVRGYTKKAFKEWVGGRAEDQLCLKLDRDPEGMYYPWKAIRKKNPKMSEVCLSPVVSAGSPPPKEICCGDELGGGRDAEFVVKVLPGPTQWEDTSSMSKSGSVAKTEAKAMVEAEVARKEGVSPKALLQRAKQAMVAAHTMMKAAKSKHPQKFEKKAVKIFSKQDKPSALEQVAKAQQAIKDLGFDAKAIEQRILARNKAINEDKPVPTASQAMEQLSNYVKANTVPSAPQRVSEKKMKHRLSKQLQDRTADVNCEGTELSSLDKIDCYLKKALVPTHSLAKEAQTKVYQGRIDALVRQVKHEVVALQHGPVQASIKETEDQLKQLWVQSDSKTSHTHIRVALKALNKLKKIVHDAKSQADKATRDRRELEKQAAIAVSRAQVFANEAAKAERQQNATVAEMTLSATSKKVNETNVDAFLQIANVLDLAQHV